jgi:hypothetical protein
MYDDSTSADDIDLKLQAWRIARQGGLHQTYPATCGHAKVLLPSIALIHVNGTSFLAAV